METILLVKFAMFIGLELFVVSVVLAVVLAGFVALVRSAVREGRITGLGYLD